MVMVDLPDSNSESPDEVMKEFDLEWVPIWSGKESVELLLEQKTVVSHLSDNDFKIDTPSKTILDKMPSINKEGIINSGVKTIVRYPIVKNNITVGYIIIHSIDPDTSSSEELVKFASLLSGKIRYVF